MRLWTSWVCPQNDYRPVTFPPNTGVLGFWCSGYDGEDRPIVCAAIEAPNEEVAADIVRIDWPEFDGTWRFIEERADEWEPGDRFGLTSWMRDRFHAKESQ